MRPLVVIYGLPGAGKTTLCRHIAEREDFYFADMPLHPEWGKGKPMWRLACELYAANGKGRGFITEGWLQYRDRREQFITKIASKLGPSFAPPLVVQLLEGVAILQSRRPHRSIGKYQEMAAAHEEGLPGFRHVNLDGGQYKTIEARAEFIRDALHH